MAGWTPITRGEVQIVGTHPEYPGLLEASIPLSEEPPPEWQDYFVNPVGVGISSSMHPPEIFGAEIRITPPDAELERYVRHVEERISSANQRYSKEVIPQLTLERQKDEMRRREEDERLATAREKAKKL